jgi:hypothetical protein
MSPLSQARPVAGVVFSDCVDDGVVVAGDLVVDVGVAEDFVMGDDGRCADGCGRSSLATV